MEPVEPQTETEGSGREGQREVRVASSTAPARRERRKRPRTWETPPARAPAPRLDDYKGIVGAAVIDELKFLAKELAGKTLKMVNSTAVGGGVAEMLNQLVPLLNELEVKTHWDVITGGNDFFEVTKAFHNPLHGSEYHLTPNARDAFLMHNELNRHPIEFRQHMPAI